MKHHLFRSRRIVAMLAMAPLIAVLPACSGDDAADTTAPAATIKINSPADIAIESAADYNANVSGLVTGKTLKRWKDDWANQHPAGVTGKLVILQTSAGEAGYEYIKTNGQNAYTYLSAAAEWSMTRSNGVISTSTVVLDGPTVDAQIKKYNIDPQNDMVVLAIGTGASANVLGQGLAWYVLHYWGVDAKNIALLNGGNKWQVDSGAMTAADFANAAPAAPNTGTGSVKNLLVDNTSLQATLQDMVAIVPSSDINVKTDHVFLWDSRTVTQYSAGVRRERQDGSGDTVCSTAYCNAAANYDYMSSFQNGDSRQGHPFGALDLNYLDLLDANSGYSFKSKAELTGYLNGEADASGYAVLDGSYNPVGKGNAYQPGDTVYTYCETSQRGGVAAIASGVILGHPTRIYDASMIEWNSLSYALDSSGKYVLPIDSPWRTEGKSYFRPAQTSAQVTPRTIVDPYAASANVVVVADRAYKAPAAK
jgi:3-mercaptopyruvate sulfurtransferase SseA